MKTNIVVKLQYEATHCWATCPIEEVSFLKYPHRHIFHIRLEKEVTHSDRDIEIIMFKREVLAYLTAQYQGDFGNNSCEMIAQELRNHFYCDCVEVLEDFENGAIVYR